MNVLAPLCLIVLVCFTSARNIKDTEELLRELQNDLEDIKQEEKRVADFLQVKNSKKSFKDEGTECDANIKCENPHSVCSGELVCVCPHGGEYPDCVEGFICLDHHDCNGGDSSLGDCVDNKCMCVYQNDTNTGCTDSCYNECNRNFDCVDGDCVCKEGLIEVGDECQVPCDDDGCEPGYECGEMNQCVCKDEEAEEGQCPACIEECEDGEECVQYQTLTSDELSWKCECEEDYVRDTNGECVEKQCGYDEDESDDDECGEFEECKNFLCKCSYGGEPGECLDQCDNQCRDDQVCVDAVCVCPEGTIEDNDECVDNNGCDNQCRDDQECSAALGCVCPHGTFESQGQCEEMECGFGGPNGKEFTCEEDQVCQDHKCICKYGGEIGDCYDECGNQCRDDQICLNDTCLCPEGLFDVQGECVEKQCDAAGTESGCDENEECRDFKCVCKYGTGADGCNDACGSQCRDDQECVGTACVCPEGKEESNGACVDVGSGCPPQMIRLKDDCVEDPCLENEVLELVSSRKARGFKCRCPKENGFTLKDGQCQNRCPEGCPTNEVCTMGGCRCDKKSGFFVVGGKCTEACPGGCGENKRCTKRGCKCNKGFKENTAGECVERK